MFFITAENQSPAGTAEIIRMVKRRVIVFRKKRCDSIIERRKEAGPAPANFPFLTVFSYYSNSSRGPVSQKTLQECNGYVWRRVTNTLRFKQNTCFSKLEE